MNSVFKDRLIQAMEVRNIKAVELAEKTGLSKARISQYMNGVYVPKSKGTHFIAKALQVDERWLMGVSDEMERDDAQTSWEDLALIAYENQDILEYLSQNPDAKAGFTTLKDADLTPAQKVSVLAGMIAHIKALEENND